MIEFVEVPDVVENFRELTEVHESEEMVAWFDQLTGREQKELLVWTCSVIDGLVGALRDWQHVAEDWLESQSPAS